MISAVVVNWNGKHYLGACLDALLQQQPPPAEIVVADNHSDDGSRVWLAEHYPQVTVVDTGHNGGPGLARNVGLRQVAHDRVLLLDNDVVLRPGALARLAARLEASPTAAAVQARVLCHDDPDVVHYDRADLHYLGLLVLHAFFAPKATATASSGPVGGAVSACLLVDRAPALAVGGFREALFFYFEDTDFTWRLRLAGHQVLHEPDAEVLHRGGTADLSLRAGRAVPAARVFWHSRNRLAVVLANQRLRTLLWTAPAELAYEAVHLMLATAQGHPIAWLRGKLALLRALPEIRQWRRRVAGMRRVCDRDLLVAEPLTVHPGLADRGAKALLRRGLDAFLAGWWRLVRQLCG